MKDETIREYVTSKLKSGYSPEQISGRIKIDLGCSISHKAIYQYIYRQVHRNGYGYLKQNCEDLRMYLKRRHRRRTKKGMRKSQRIFRPYGLSIEERPLEVNTRKTIEHWERGSNENTNGLIRWYFPKSTDFAKVTDEEIKEVEYALNTRPRKRLKWRTPLEVFNSSVALAH